MFKRQQRLEFSIFIYDSTKVETLGKNLRTCTFELQRDGAC